MKRPSSNPLGWGGRSTQAPRCRTVVAFAAFAVIMVLANVTYRLKPARTDLAQSANAFDKIDGYVVGDFPSLCASQINEISSLYFSLPKTSAHYLSIGRRALTALQPVICATDFLTAKGIFVDVGMGGGDDLRQWLDMFASSGSGLAAKTLTRQMELRSLKYCSGGKGVDKFVFYEPQPSLQGDIVNQVRVDADHRRRRGVPPLNISLFVAAVGEDELSGHQADLVQSSDGTAHIDLKKTKAILSGARTAAPSGASESWVPVVGLRASLHAAFNVAGGTPGEARSDFVDNILTVRRLGVASAKSPVPYPTVPVLHLDTPRMDSYIILKNAILFNEGKVGVAIFKADPLAAAATSVSASLAVKMLIAASYKVYVVGVANMTYRGTSDMPALALASIDTSLTFASAWNAAAWPLTLVAMHQRVFETLPIVYAGEMASSVSDGSRHSVSPAGIKWPRTSCMQQLILLPTPGMGWVDNQRLVPPPDTVWFSSGFDAPVNELLRPRTGFHV